MADKTDQVLELVIKMGEMILLEYDKTHDGYTLAERLCFLLIVLRALREGPESETMFELKLALSTMESLGGSQIESEPI